MLKSEFLETALLYLIRPPSQERRGLGMRDEGRSRQWMSSGLTLSPLWQRCLADGTFDF